MHEPEWLLFNGEVGEADRERDASRLVTVTCLPRMGCGRERGAGALLADVVRTSRGALWRSTIVVAHDVTPTFQELHGDQAMPMHHPVTGGTAWITRRAFERIWRHEGWVEVSAVPAALSEKFRPQRAQYVRDLINREDLPHVSLRVKCPRHGLAVLDRGLVCAEAQTAAQTRPRYVPISKLRAV